MRDMLWAFVRADEARRQLAANLAAFRGEIQVLPCEQSVTSGRPSIPSAEPVPSSSPSLVQSPAPPATTPTPTPTRTLKVPTPYAIAQSIAPVHLSASSRPKADGIVLLLTSAVCAAMVGLLLLPRRATPQTQTQTQIAMAPSAEAPPQESAVPSNDPAPSEAPPVPASSGTLISPAAGVSHRVYVDGRVVGESGQTFLVRCGEHVVRIGSAGRDQHVLVPCGGEISIQTLW
jgi:hypothetical protein